MMFPRLLNRWLHSLLIPPPNRHRVRRCGDRG